MMKLNNKGMTTVEILVTFVIVVIIVTSLYSSVVALKNKETIASYKESLIAYRDLLTRDIQKDLIEKGLSNFSHTVDTNNATDTIHLTLGNNQQKTIVITHKTGCQAITEEEVSDSDLCPTHNKSDGDQYNIKYGDIEYKLPNIGSDKNIGNKNIYDLKIDSVSVDEVSGENNIFDLKIIFYHPDLGTKYSMHITSPINFE